MRFDLLARIGYTLPGGSVTMKIDLRSVLGKQLIVFDGGMGTMLQAAGLPAGVQGETWNLDEPEKVLRIQKAYAAAGCDVLTANTFGANRLKYARTGRSVEETVQAGIRIARQALAEGRPEDLCRVRGDGWVALDMGPTGQFLEPLGDLSFADCVEVYAEMVRAAEAMRTAQENREEDCGGADLILIETMIDLEETRAAVTAARENSDLPVIATVTLEKNGRMLLGADLEEMAETLEEAGADALGLNCGFGPENMLEHLKTLRKLTELPVLITPNAGLPRKEGDRIVYDIHPEEFSVLMKEIVAVGANAVGGCCGTTPAHMEAVVRSVRDE